MIINVAFTVIFVPDMEAEGGPRWIYFRYDEGERLYLD